MSGVGVCVCLRVFVNGCGVSYVCDVSCLCVHERGCLCMRVCASVWMCVCIRVCASIVCTCLCECVVNACLYAFIWTWLIKCVCTLPVLTCNCACGCVRMLYRFVSLCNCV